MLTKYQSTRFAVSQIVKQYAKRVSYTRPHGQWTIFCVDVAGHTIRERELSDKEAKACLPAPIRKKCIKVCGSCFSSIQIPREQWVLI